MPKLSLVIVAQNEERNLGDLLSAAKPLADEIVLVDSGSSDSTVDIARAFGAKVIHQDWLGYARQKNFALDQASHDWVLSLDADEVLSPPLVAEIASLLAGNRLELFDGYRMPRLLYIGRQAVAHGGFYPDAQLRLFRKSKGRFNERAVHERVFVEGKVGALAGRIEHFAYRDVAEFGQAMEKYARLSAEHHLASGHTWWQTSVANQILHPCWTFFYRYLIRAGWLDGELGLKLNLIYSDYVRRKIMYLRQALSN